MDITQELVQRCAQEDRSEADEASATLDQALNVLYEIAIIEGPGAIVDAYELSAWRKGGNVFQTEAVICRANLARRQATLSS